MRLARPLALLTAALLGVVPMAASQPQSRTDSAGAAGKSENAVTPSKGEQAKVDRSVSDRIRGGGAADFWVHFRGQADLSAASGISDWAERGRYVVEQLRATAKSNQASAIGQLKSENVRHREFWAVNAVLVRGGTAQTVEAMKRRPEVREIRAHAVHEVPDPAPGTAQLTGPVEWGIANINADQAWETFGTRGEGIVVANIDSGVQFDHPALVGQYRGTNGDGTFSHDHNWHDPSEVCGGVGSSPCDNNGHGTHTMGTMVGDDGVANHVGVAPNARWIAAKGCEEASCSEFALVSSGQWMLAPTAADGTNPDPSRRPHVVNNSWGGGSGNTWYQEIVRAWVAAGIFPAFANGNSGYGVCGTVGDPGSYPESYGVGAYDIANEIAEFSSLGPSAVDGSVKPDASAPGVDVRSTVPGDGYDTFSGTSMATPHLSGAVALMLSAAPALVGDVEATKALLDSSARDTADSAGCGGTLGNNNTFGEGRIDVLAAVDASPRGEVATLTGTVTDAVGAPIVGAEVLVSGGVVPRRTRTDTAGGYVLTLSAGTYDVTAGAYGYAAASRVITIGPGETGRADFVLAAVPRSTLHGTVRDGSGHGWPLYARLDITGYPGGPVFTDPVTGAYAVELAHGVDYGITVTSLIDGYLTASRPLALPADEAVQDFALSAVASCATPGYSFGVQGLYESFDSTTAPAGWQVVDNLGSGQEWEFEDFAFRQNRTGGDGGFAIVDSDLGGGQQDTELITPTVDLTAVGTPFIQFDQDLRAFADEIFDVDLSTDDGVTWTTVWRTLGQSGDGSLRGPRQDVIPIPAAAGQAAVKVRFHYYEADFAWWWQVDNVLVGQSGCVPIPGGMVVGNATDGRTGAPVNDAVITGPTELRATTVPTPGDDAVPDGFYALFAPGSGTQSFTATKKLYGATTLAAEVAPDDVVRLDFPLRAGHLSVGPPVERTVAMGERVETTLTVANDGTADARVELTPRAGGVRIAATGAAPRRVPAAVTPGRLVDTAAPAAAAAPEDAPWEDIADHPVRVADNAAATFDGEVYSVGGFSPGIGGLDHLYIHDPVANTWRRGADTDEIRDKPAAAFLGGKLHVVGGFDDFGVGRGAKRTMEVYDPATDRWTAGPDAPYGSAGAGSAVLDGKLYLVGGCSGDSCHSQTETARFDPVAGAWESLSPYPLEIAWTSCAGDDRRNRVYCAGGIDFDGTTSAYAYDPESDQWTPIASLPIPLWGSAYAAANGQLAISGGVTGNDLTNEGFVYDPFADAWDPLPPSNNTTYRGAGACGLYRIGGIPAGAPTAASEVLRGYGHCESGAVPWLSMAPSTMTVPAGASVEVTVTLDAAQVDQPGTHTAAIVVSDDTPYTVSPVPVALTVTPPASWGKLTGTVTGLGRCDTGVTALRESTVDIDGVVTDFSLEANGSYAVWMDQANGPVTVTVSANGHVRQVRAGVPISAGGVTVEDFALRLDQGCASVAPGQVAIEVDQDATATADVALRNAGGGAYGFTIAETPFVFEPVSGPGPNTITGSGWFGGASLPGGGLHYGHAQCDGDVGRFYVFGGVDIRKAARDTAWRYNVATNTWTELAAIPQALESPTAVCELGQIHLLGGSGTTAHYVYDIAADVWSPAAPLPRPVRGAASAVWNGKIHLVGGDADLAAGGTTGQVDVYDLTTDTWTGVGAPMPVPAVAAGARQAGRFLYVVGGWDDASPATNVTAAQRLDLATGAWTTGPALAAAPADFALAATDKAIYAIGGDQPGGGFSDGSDTMFRLDTTAWPAGGWTPDDRLPLRMSGNSAGFCTLGFLGGEIWSVSGVDQFRTTGGEAYLHDVGTERCATMRADVPWLSVAPATGTVAPDATVPVRVTVNATGLLPGEHGATLLISTTDSGAPELRLPIRVTVRAAAPVHLLSLAGSGVARGVGYADEDVLGITAAGKVVPYFDGSDVGLGPLTVDAFAKLPDGSLVLSFAKPGSVQGIAGKVDDSDLVRFVPTSLGATTAGTFELWLDGSDVGLSTDGEDLDAVDVLPDGRVVLSTEGIANVTGVTSGDHDLTVFTPTTLGATTAGTFALHLDGRDIGLTTTDEGIDAAAVRADGLIALSTLGPLAVPGLSAADDDVVGFVPTRLGPDTRGTFDPTPLLDGTAFGLDATDVTAFDFA
ncbi:Serine protease, subtilisin family [Actinokineospora alba]|uniref:Serine protease, subtilisin family n=1 Tax=Actinokineospora alba TaxID=504798 RepID=A0A1H0F187_9PSEU|nr:S8 family serine peptidase [Actinokineospora alba]TDP69301.1 subtilisin family serine protease [Actinokineospora alba]SDI19805.1 Serine protease, subtilisin family [Actinokineospora alba]SDN88404.1 Serine protease, subtilisin family [Actinokineospora alba]